MKHFSVLSNEVIDKLNPKDDKLYVDATLGFGGHTKRLLENCPNCNVIAFDQDKKALKKAKENLINFQDKIYFINDNFSNLKSQVNKLGFDKVDGIIYDLGTSYYQLTSNERGFTFHGESKLDMRMNQDQSLSAINVINEYDEEKLVEIMLNYGDEKKAKQIAKKIVEFRKKEKIIYNTQLNEIIKSVKGFQKGKHPSKNIFQAIRMEVNNELNVIKRSLDQAFKLLNKNGKILVITFHSIEDRLVKDIFWKKKQDIEITSMGNNHKYKTFKKIYPTQEEILENPASRSSKLRIIEKLI